VEAFHRLVGLLPLGAAADPPPALRARVLAAAAEAPAARRPGLHLVPRLVGAVAALLALTLGIDAYRARRELALERELRTALQEPNVVLTFALGGRGDAAGATGRVSLDLDAHRGPPSCTGSSRCRPSGCIGCGRRSGIARCRAVRSTPRPTAR
jgi:hypothetical protein